MKSANEMITHYNNRMTSSQVDPVLSAVNTTAKANYASHAIAYTALLASVHNYLDGEGVLPVEYFNYDGFAGAVYHIANHFSGAAAIAGAVGMQVKWILYGCTAPRLKAIAAIFGIVIP